MDTIPVLVRCPYCNQIIESCDSGTTYEYKNKPAWIHWHPGCGDFIVHERRKPTAIENRYHLPEDFKRLILPVIRNILFTNKNDILSLPEDQIENAVITGVKHERNLNIDFININTCNIKLMTQAIVGYINPPALTSESLTAEKKAKMKVSDVVCY